MSIAITAVWTISDTTRDAAQADDVKVFSCRIQSNIDTSPQNDAFDPDFFSIFGLTSEENQAPIVFDPIYCFCLLRQYAGVLVPRDTAEIGKTRKEYTDIAGTRQGPRLTPSMSPLSLSGHEDGFRPDEKLSSVRNQLLKRSPLLPGAQAGSA